MDEVEKELQQVLREQPGADARTLRREVARRSGLESITRRTINSLLYRGLSIGRYRRSDDQRPGWFLTSPGVPSVPAAADDRDRIGMTLGELTRELGLPAPGDDKLAFRKVGERMVAAADDRRATGTLRVIRVDASLKPVEDVQFGTLRFADLVATPFERSSLRGAIGAVRFIVFADERPRERSRLIADVRWEPSKHVLDAMGEDYEAVRRAIAGSRIEDLPSGPEVRYLRYGTKAVDGSDVDELPDGRRSTRRGFYLVKRSLVPVLRSLIGDREAPGEATEAGRQRPEATSPNEALLLGLLREQLDDG